MATLLATRMAVAVGGLALSLTAGAGVAFADPLDAAINTTCTYSQAVAALNALSPETAQQFNASPAAQAWVRTFFGSPVNQRQQMAQQMQSVQGLKATLDWSSRSPTAATTTERIPGVPLGAIDGTAIFELPQPHSPTTTQRCAPRHRVADAARVAVTRLVNG